jgi:hypothetical protein
MAKLDRLGWKAGVAFTAHGCRAGVRVDDPGIMERLFELLPPGWRPASSPSVDHLFSLIVGGRGRGGTRRYHLAYSGSGQLARSFDLDETLRTLEVGVHYHIAEHAPRRIFVHAGVVGWNGYAIVIPGRSWSGKSRLVEALVRAGGTYYSDEFAVLDDRGRVHPYPIPLARRDRKNGKASRRPVEDLGGTVGRSPLPVGLVIVTRYRRGASWRPRRLSRGKALLELLNHTIPARRRPERALDALTRVVDRAPTWKGVRGGARDLVVRLESRWDELSPRAAPAPVEGGAAMRGAA